MTAARRDRILARLRADGGRVTTARRALISALLDADDHVTADDLAASVQAAHPDVHRSTIYRTLDALERLGVVDHVHLGHGRAVYHLADEPHHHLVCDTCGYVVEVPEELFDELAGRLRSAYGFTIRPRHFAVVGRCDACAEPAPEPANDPVNEAGAATESGAVEPAAVEPAPATVTASG